MKNMMVCCYFMDVFLIFHGKKNDGVREFATVDQKQKWLCNPSIHGQPS